MMIKCFLVITLLLNAVGLSAEIRLVDVAGRTVVLEKPAKKIVLGEGRFLSVLGVLGIERPLNYVAGMMNEFKIYDSASYAQYKKVFPNIDKIPVFGHTNEQSVSVEKIILLNPDVAIFGLYGHGPSAKSTHIIDRLSAAGIAVLFIDFRQDPINNTPKSVELVAAAIGQPEKGKAFANFYRAEIARVQQRVENLQPEERPLVLFELRASASQECCLSVAKGLFAAMGEVAGGKSYAQNLLAGPVGNVSREYILSHPFDIYIGTAIGSMSEGLPYNYLLAGPQVEKHHAKEALHFYLQSRGFDKLPAIRGKRAHVLWHHFYNSPLNLYAIQTMATWFHPEKFKDIDPENTLKQLFAGFYPVKLQGSYGASLGDNIE